MGIARNDIGETCSAAAFDSKIPQERAQAGRQLLDGSIAAMARAVQEKAANGGRFPLFWIVPERRHQIRGVAGVELDRGIGRSAVLAQPHFEVSHQARHGMLQCRSGGPANADFDKVLAKEPGAENGVVVAAPSHGAGTSTSAQVLAEHCQINVARHYPLPSHDMAEVRCRPQISHGRAGAIPLPLERGRQGMVRLARSANAPASSMPRSRSPTCSFPFVIGHRWPSQRRRRTALLWRAGAATIYRKMPIPARQLPITNFAHKAGNGRRPLPAAIGIARNARARRLGNGSPNARRSCCRFPTTMSSSPCRQQSARSRFPTRPPSTTSCSGPPPRR